MSDSLQPYVMQHARPPCPSPSPGVCSNSCPLSRWCHITISPSVVPFSCLSSFLASGSFPMSRLFASGGQSIGVSASASVLPMNIRGWFPLGLTGLIFLLFKGLSKESSKSSLKASILWCSAFFIVRLEGGKAGFGSQRVDAQALLQLTRPSSAVYPRESKEHGTATQVPPTITSQFKRNAEWDMEPTASELCILWVVPLGKQPRS